MFTNNVVEQETNEVDVFDVIISCQDNKNITDKKRRAQRMSAARRAIEKHNESLQLTKDLAEVWQ